MIVYLALGALLLLLFTSAGRMAVFQARGWKFLTAAAAIAAFAGAAFTALREAWVPAAVLLVMGLWLAASARRTGGAQAAVRSPGMSLGEARSILGVDEDATPAQIQAAYKRLMRLAHPDKGGTTGLASQLNAARTRLLQEA
jgi:hypothetical protein